MIRRWGALLVALVVFAPVLVGTSPASSTERGDVGSIRYRLLTPLMGSFNFTGHVSAIGISPGATELKRDYVISSGVASGAIYGLKPGAYLLYAEPGHDSYYAPEWYKNAHNWWEPGLTVVYVYPGEATYGVDIWVDWGAEFLGVVRDEEGTSLDGVLVTAFDPATGWAFSDKTDATGFFWVRGAPPGDYLIAYDPPYRVGSASRATSYYDGVGLASEATPIHVEKSEHLEYGVRVEGLDAVLGPDASISGTRGWPGAGHISAWTSDGWFYWHETVSAGRYRIDHLPPDQYRVGFFTDSPGFIEGWHDGAVSNARSVPLDAPVDADLTDVNGAPRSVPCDRTGPPAFPDVPPAHLFCYDINWLELAGITGGFDDGTFRPTAQITRQSFAAFLSRYPTDELAEAPTEAPFPDVPLDHPFAVEINWLDATGITGGYPDGTFRPGSAVTREAVAAFLYRLAGEPEFTPIPAQIFSDVPQTHTFFKEIMWMWQSGIADGRPDGSFGATDPISRQAMAAFLHRYDLSVGGPGAGVDPRLDAGAPSASARTVVPPPVFRPTGPGARFETPDPSEPPAWPRTALAPQP